MASKESITFDGKEYILSKEAARETGYTQDYIGQLAREGYILARRVGGLWYINLDSLQEHKEGDEEEASNETAQKDSSQNSSVEKNSNAEYMTSKEAAQKLGYTQDYVGQLLRSGRLPGKRIGGHWHVENTAVEAHKREQESAQTKTDVTSVGLKKEPAQPQQKVPSLEELGGGPLLTYLPGEGADEAYPLSARDGETRFRDNETRNSESRPVTKSFDNSDRAEMDEPTPITVRPMSHSHGDVRSEDENQKHVSSNRKDGEEYGPDEDLVRTGKRSGKRTWVWTSIVVVGFLLIMGFIWFLIASYLNNRPEAENTQNMFESVISVFVPSLEYTRE